MSTETIQPGGNTSYHRAKPWQMACFAGNTAAYCVYNVFIGYMAYFMYGGFGIATVAAGTMLTAFRVWDAATDPILAWLLDRTDGKFGKFRPFIICGDVLMAVTCFLMFYVSYTLPKAIAFPAFLVFYLLYVLGYTAQGICSKGAQSCLTSDPKQRATYAMFDMVLFAIGLMGATMTISMVYAPKYPDLRVEFFKAVYPVIAIAGAVFTIMAVVGISEWDKTQYFGTGKKSKEKIKISDYIDVVKSNRAIQMMILSACSDRLTGNVATNAAVNVVLFGIICGNFGMSGLVSMAGALCSIPIVMLVLNYSKKTDSKHAMILISWAGIVILILTFLLLQFCDPHLSMAPLNFFTVAFLALRILYQTCTGSSSSLVNPMCGDCADYEVYLSGRYCPGLIGSLYSGIDKFISSFTTMIVAGCFALIGFTDSLPTLETPSSPALRAMCYFILCGLPMIGFAVNIIAMKFYPLDRQKMEEINSKKMQQPAQ